MASTHQGNLITFAKLWTSYPSDEPCINPATGRAAYEDQCAIKLGTALHGAGVNFASFQGPVCKFLPSGSGGVLRAQELADWLTRRPFPGCPAPLIITRGKDFDKRITGLTGIAFFQHYWLREGEKEGANRAAPHGTGNHIDLWNINTLTPDHGASFWRFKVGIQHFHVGRWGYSDLHNATKVMFWRIP